MIISKGMTPNKYLRCKHTQDESQIKMLETSSLHERLPNSLSSRYKQGEDRCMQSCSISQVITSPWGIHRCHAQPLYDCKMQLRPPQGSPTVMHWKLPHKRIFLYTMRHLKSVWFWWVITKYIWQNYLTTGKI